MNFGYFVCNSQQGRYRSERNSPEIHVQSGDDDSYPVVSQLVAYINQTFVKKLRFVAEIGFSQRRWGYGMDVILYVRLNRCVLIV